MTRQLSIKCFTGLIAILFLSGCIASSPVKPLPAFSPSTFSSDNYTSKVDSFLIIFDASSSMLSNYNGNNKFATAKAFVDRMNQTIPQLDQKAGLRSFGHDPSVSKNDTELFYGMNNYSTDGLSEGLDKIGAAGGCSPLYKALQGAEKDLATLPGKKVVIIVSDGQKQEMIVSDTLEYARQLKNKYGSSLCIYTIAVGASPEGVTFLEKVAEIGGCGFFSNADNLLAGAPMAAFVEKVFLSKKSKPAPKKKKKVKKVKKVKEVKKAKPVKKAKKDSDHDGVFDEDDLCPNTPRGAKVNHKGCWSFGDALFDYNKAEIKPGAYKILNNACTIFKQNPAMTVTLKGHTDSKGAEKYNMILSLKRATSVKNYLVNKGVDPSRLTCKAFGESKPIATNDTDKGRSLNRRVELSPDK